MLVDKGETKGVFNSWDDAETFADENDIPLDFLMEYETNPDHPDHLHLMSALTRDSWEFVGLWTKRVPAWTERPVKIRLEHYYLRGESFVLLRQKEFPWRPGILDRINPMAPDSALIPEEIVRPNPTSTSEWKPKLSPLRPVGNKTPPPPGLSISKGPMVEESGSIGPEPAEEPKVEKAESVSPAPEAAESEDQPREKPSWKRKPLRLKSTKNAPQPIPVYKAPVERPSDETGKSPLEMAQAEVQEGNELPEDSENDGPVRKIIPLRLIIPVVAIVLFWGIGVFYVFRPEPTAQKTIPEITTLNRADILIIEPGQVFFQLPVDPVNQHRWVNNLELSPIAENNPFEIPTMHALETWEKGDTFIRPPYAEIEVREWWDLRLRKVVYGFYHTWEDGSILILDLESDMLIGWAEVSRLPDLLN